ncbi:MAG: hypothetical protein V1875_08475 [Candidatus Altiarchaeota archaeon]
MEFGIESANEGVRERVLGKKFTNQDVGKVAGWLKELGIRSTAYFILGLPGENIDDLIGSNMMAYMLAEEYGVETKLVAGTTLFPGTKVTGYARRRGLVPDLNWTGVDVGDYMAGDLPILAEHGVGAGLINLLQRELDVIGMAKETGLQVSPLRRYSMIHNILAGAKFGISTQAVRDGEIEALHENLPSAPGKKEPPAKN